MNIQLYHVADHRVLKSWLHANCSEDDGNNNNNTIQGYVYSIFNLVYDTNVASLRIWDGLGFERIGRVKGAGRLRSYPDRYVDAIIYGRVLEPTGSSS